MGLLPEYAYILTKKNIAELPDADALYAIRATIRELNSIHSLFKNIEAEICEILRIF